MSEPRFFATPARLRAWFEKNHERATELWVGFHKKDSGRPSITWPESVEQALCFGWIDGVRKSIDEASYKIRFSPRKARSSWSAVNVRLFAKLQEGGLVVAAGLRAFEARTASGYSYEQKRDARLDLEQEKAFRSHARAWAWFESRPPGYRRNAIHWITSAKRPETRVKRLATLIECCAAGRLVPPLAPPGGK